MGKKSIYIIVFLLILILVLIGFLLKDYVSISIAGLSENELEEEKTEYSGEHAAATPGTTLAQTTAAESKPASTTGPTTATTLTPEETPPPPPGGGSFGVAESETPMPEGGGSFGVAFNFTFSPTSGPPGTEVNIYLSEARNVIVAYKGNVLPKKTSADGKTLTVTIPGGATSGYFQVLWDGGSYQSPDLFTVTP